MERMDFEEGCSRSEDKQIETHSFGSIISYTSKPRIDKERLKICFSGAEISASNFTQITRISFFDF